ncbi:MAG: hypothetical protein QF733_08085 [Phycisphaerales bacterium]|jgi:hypothetical protein|nr:hypothetical protein [Phycisphaerales bacterium]
MMQFESMEPASLESPYAQVQPVPQWVGVVSIVIGILGLLCWGGSAAMTIAASSMQGMMEGAPQLSAAHRTFEFAVSIAGVVLGLWLIAAGSGIASGRPWGRRGVRLWGIVRLAVAIVGLLGALYWIDEVVAASEYALAQQAAEAADAGATHAESPEITADALSAITIVFAFMQTVAISIWPIVVLVVTRKRCGT